MENLNSQVRRIFVTFKTQEHLIFARTQLQSRNLYQIETFSAHDLETEEEQQSDEAQLNPLARAALVGGLIGGFGMWGLQWYASVRSAPLWIGGKPLNSWPSFLPIIFVCSILGAGLFLATHFFLHLGFPRPWHPVFEARGYDLSRAPYSLLISAPSVRDTFQLSEFETLLKSLNANLIEVLA